MFLDCFVTVAAIRFLLNPVIYHSVRLCFWIALLLWLRSRVLMYYIGKELLWFQISVFTVVWACMNVVKKDTK